MAQSSSCFDEIVEHDGLKLLLSFLNLIPHTKLSEAELAACERVHQKSAIALTRLAKEAKYAQIVVNSGGINPSLHFSCRLLLLIITVSYLAGVQRLVQLCKDGAARNSSDVVLVACLVSTASVLLWYLCVLCILCSKLSMTDIVAVNYYLYVVSGQIFLYL